MKLWRHLNVLLAAMMFSHGIFSAKASSVTSIEMMGRSILYGIQFDFEPADQWRTGIGLGRSGAQTGGREADVHFVLLPLYSNFYLGDEGTSPFLTAGVTVRLGADSLIDQRTSILGNLRYTRFPVIPTFGLGYQWFSASHFVLRTAGIVLWSQNIALGFSLSLGIQI